MASDSIRCDIAPQTKILKFWKLVLVLCFLAQIFQADRIQGQFVRLLHNFLLGLILDVAALTTSRFLMIILLGHPLRTKNLFWGKSRIGRVAQVCLSCWIRSVWILLSLSLITFEGLSSIIPWAESRAVELILLLKLFKVFEILVKMLVIILEILKVCRMPGVSILPLISSFSR